MFVSVRPGALPNYQIVLIDIFAPLVGAALWWLMARANAGAVQAGRVSNETKDRQRTEFWAILVLGYIVMFGLSIYYWLT
jgi:hypothetical protein